MRGVLLGVIRLYRATLSRLLPPRCRFHPSCSAYALLAIGRFGAGRGGLLTLWRLLRCNPLVPGGLDPVPETFGWHAFRLRPAGPVSPDPEHPGELQSLTNAHGN